jgi:pyridoxamine 5'-phosphate oxidase
MIDISNISDDAPYSEFKKKYKNAIENNQKNIEAICLSSYSSTTEEVNSRFVNIKQIIDKEFIFYSNYSSPKASEFEENKKVSAVFFWNSVNVQIRMKATIKKKSKLFNQLYFESRSINKNALAISSCQSQVTSSYESIIKNYEEALASKDLKTCPEYWGGYSITPYSFEFWEGHKYRLNKRNLYENKNKNWSKKILEP